MIRQTIAGTIGLLALAAPVSAAFSTFTVNYQNSRITCWDIGESYQYTASK
jgi:hypothetical protein